MLHLICNIIKNFNSYRRETKSVHTGEEPYIYDFIIVKVSKGAKIRNRYNQVPHLTQDTNGKVTNSKLDNTN